MQGRAILHINDAKPLLQNFDLQTGPKDVLLHVLDATTSLQ